MFRPAARAMIRRYGVLPDGFAPKKILATRIQGAGDVLMTTPAIQALRQHFPNAEIHYLVGDQAVEMLQDNPAIDCIVPIPEAALFSRSVKHILPYIRTLRKQKYDLGISFSRSAGLHGFLAACNIGFRVGFDKNGSGGLLHLPVTLESRVRYEVLDYLELVRALGISNVSTEMGFCLTAKEKTHALQLLKAVGLEANSKYAMLSVGGGRNPGWDVPQKRWSMQSFAELADRFDFPVVVVGDDVDSREAEPWFGKGKRVVNLCGKLSLRDTAALLKYAKVLVTNDTVTMHLAVIAGIPTLALFGPTHPSALLPEGIGNVRYIQAKLPCAPCFWQNMPHHVSNFGDANFPGCPMGNGLSPCLSTITVSEVCMEIGRLLHPLKEV
jgi:ADP-heptose:LPS heptosyltransferase